MIGIVSTGAYIPCYRMDRKEIAKAWAGGSLGGEKAVANYDEDSLTMAVESGFNCLKGRDKERVGGLFFCSTTPPYREKQSSSLMATVLDLKKDVHTADFTDTLRGGTAALISAMDAVKGSPGTQVLVSTADCRMGVPQSNLEQLFGDAGASLLIGSEDVAVSIDEVYFINDEIVDLWRREEDRFVTTWEERFILTHGYSETITEVIKGILKKSGLSPRDFARVIIYGPDTRTQSGIIKRLKFDPESQAQDMLFSTIGNAGSSQVFLGLAKALETAKPGDRLLLASYGNGADAFIMTVTDNIQNLKTNGLTVSSLIEKRRLLRNYSHYGLIRGIIQGESARRPSPSSSVPLMWREGKQLLSLYGQRCRRCSTVQFPMQRVCFICMAKDEFDEVPLSSERGVVYTYTKDFLFGSVDPPQVMAVVELENGCRLYLQMTDRDPDEVDIDMPVELCFRRLNDASGFHNYFWKCRPCR